MIRVLDKNIADKIAAGEVIDRPVSIVKELVENGLDAEAASITVEIKKGGKEYLRVTDDGSGIPAEEVEVAFLRHATSKIRQESDLDAIHSLGFRGEALASICAVARVEMITKTGKSHTGRHVICEDSRILKNTATGCPDGTTITVRDLFFNVPARRKFLATDGAEARRIVDLMSRIALAYPDVKFQVINGSREVFRTTGKGNILDNIGRIYGRDMCRDLVPVDVASDKGYLLRGFVSSPAASATSHSRQFFCVNGRVVTSPVLERGLQKAYRERLFPGRFPIAFLFLQLPADQLDVNVHPTKKEIRFDDSFAVEDFVTEAVARALTQRLAIPASGAANAVPSPVASQEETSPEGLRSRDAALPQGSGPGLGSEAAKDRNEGAASESGSARERTEDPSMEAGSAKRPKEIKKPPKGEDGDQVDIKSLLQTFRNEEDQKANLQESSLDYEATARQGLSRLDIRDLEVIGIAFQTYILAVEGDTLYMIDQHAAHERVFYERLLGQYHAADKLSQQLLVPLQITVSAEVEQAEDSWIGYLRQMGYDMEFFGNRTYLVRALPAFAREGEGEQFLRDLMLGLEEAPDLHSFAALDRLITRSCKSAVKGGDSLHPEEIQALLHQLQACDNPWSCPHGRPTIIRMSRGEIERMFKR